MKRSYTIIWGFVLFLMFGTGNVNAKSGGVSDDSKNVLGVKVPKIESFVLVTNEEGANIYKSASAESPWRVIWLENDEEEGEVQVDVTWSNKKAPSKYTVENAVEYEGECLLLLGEEGDFWKVNIFEHYAPSLEVGYIRKSDAEMVAFEPLTADMIKAPNDEKLSPTVVKTGGKFAGLVMDIGSDEEWGEEWIDVGVLVNGMIVTPESSKVTLRRDDEVKSLKFVWDKECGGVLLRYPEPMMTDSEGALGTWFDPAKLTDNQIEQMLKVLGKQKKSKGVKCECRIPQGDGSRQTFYIK
ncbi:MAG: hypothetical protein J6T11_08890 [Bacteroidaceae bacterium]|nr:hypothetical protein [Bacteroidaceae bacterium]